MDVAPIVILCMVVTTAVPSGAAALDDHIALDPGSVAVDDDSPAATVGDASR
jgi:hypothetical protein